MVMPNLEGDLAFYGRLEFIMRNRPILKMKKSKIIVQEELEPSDSSRTRLRMGKRPLCFEPPPPAINEKALVQSLEPEKETGLLVR